MKVKDIMTRDVAFCTADTRLRDAADRMRTRLCGTLPVVDSQGQVVGMLTDRDIAMAAASGDRDSLRHPVREVMSTHVRGCLAYDDVASALREMVDAGVRRLPVLDARGHLVGILSLEDLALKAMAGDGLGADQFVAAYQALCRRSATPRPSVPSGPDVRPATPASEPRTPMALPPEDDKDAEC